MLFTLALKYPRPLFRLSLPRWRFPILRLYQNFSFLRSILSTFRLKTCFIFTATTAAIGWEHLKQLQYSNKVCMEGSGCGFAGKVVDSDTRGPQFESSHLSSSFTIQQQYRRFVRFWARSSSSRYCTNLGCQCKEGMVLFAFLKSNKTNNLSLVCV